MALMQNFFEYKNKVIYWTSQLQIREVLKYRPLDWAME